MIYTTKRFSSYPVVLFLNGWGEEDSRKVNFREIFTKFYPGKTITYDYMGRTDQALRDLRRISADIIVGYSFGGYLAEKLDSPLRVLVCPLLSFGKPHADFLRISYNPLKSVSGNGDTIGIFGGNDMMVGKIDQDIFKEKYGEPEIIPNMKHKPSPEFWKDLAKRLGTYHPGRGPHF